YSTYHPRCGTSFLMTVMIISMIVYMLIPVHTFWARFAIRIVFLPLIAGVSYEIIRFAAKHRGSLFALMTAPGLWLQRITTQPPDDREVECAIIALDEAMKLERLRGGELVIAPRSLAVRRSLFAARNHRALDFRKHHKVIVHPSLLRLPWFA